MTTGCSKKKKMIRSIKKSTRNGLFYCPILQCFAGINSMTLSKLEGGFIWLIFPYHCPSLREVGAGTEGESWREELKQRP